MSSVDEYGFKERRSGEKDSDYRSPYMRDECRVVHCSGFRRLQGKTQVYSPDQSDYHRNRITHSIEVASISRSIIAYIRSKKDKFKKIHKYLPDDYLITAVGLLHDIGHPAFGHGGEIALNYKMREHGGFEGNAHTIRLLTKLDQYTDEYGLDLTRRTLLGIMKYPAAYDSLCKKVLSEKISKNRDILFKDWKPPKCYFKVDHNIFEWLIEKLSKNDKDKLLNDGMISKPTDDEHGKTRYKTLDCSIMEIADDISNAFHDIEDAIYLGILEASDLKKAYSTYEKEDRSNFKYIEKFINENKKLLFSENEYERKKVISVQISKIIRDVKLKCNSEFNCPYLKYNFVLNRKSKDLLVFLRKYFIKRYIIESSGIKTIDYGGALIIMQLFDAISSDPVNLLPEKIYKKMYEGAQSVDDQKRVICDYIANMTDNYALRLHDRLYGGKERSILDNF